MDTHNMIWKADSCVRRYVPWDFGKAKYKGGAK